MAGRDWRTVCHRGGLFTSAGTLSCDPTQASEGEIIQVTVELAALRKSPCYVPSAGATGGQLTAKSVIKSEGAPCSLFRSFLCESGPDVTPCC